MKFLYRSLKVTCYFIVLMPLALLSACTSLYDFSMVDSYNRIKQVQVLDPSAAERNDGVILSLEGNYGRKVMVTYRESSVAPTSGQQMDTSIISNSK